MMLSRCSVPGACGRLTIALLVAMAAGCGDSAPSMAPRDGGDDRAPPDQAGPQPDSAAVKDAGDGPGSDEITLPPLTTASPWLTRDIGDPDIKGSLAPVSTGFSIRGGGTGLDGTADGFFFAYQKLTGDGEIVVRVSSLLKVAATGQVGITIRANDTSAGAQHVTLCLLGDGTQGGSLRSRVTDGAKTEAKVDASLGQAQLLRLVRTSKVVSAYRGDGQDGWIMVGVIEAVLPPEIALGLIATGGAAGASASAELDLARIENLDSAPQTKGWLLRELGTVGASAVVVGGRLTVAALGDRKSTTGDSGAFVQMSASGINTITARVEAFVGSSDQARVGLMIREGAPESPAIGPAFAFMGVSLDVGAQFQNRSLAGGTAQAGAGMSGVRAPVWLKLEKLDDLATKTSSFRGFLSPDGKTWEVLDSLSFPLRQPYSIGIFLLAGSDTQFASARIGDISVTTPK